MEFTKIDMEYPAPNRGKETYGEYYERIGKLKEIGFHLGDLSWTDYEIYCKGSGQYYIGNEIFDENKIIK